MKTSSETPDSSALRALAVLEYVVKADGPVSLDDATQGCRLPKPTVYRILGLLQRNGFLQREPASKRYSVGARLSSFALDVLQSSTLRMKRRQILRNLVAEIGETCNFTMLDGSEVLYLDRVETTASVRLHLEAGARLPLHCTASGKLFLSQLPAAEVHELLGSEPFQRYTDHTITDYATLEAALQRIRAEGVGTDDAEYDRDSVCIAVPVNDKHGRVSAALAVHGPSSRMTIEKALQYLPALRATARQLEETLVPRVPEASPTEARATPAKAKPRKQHAEATSTRATPKRAVARPAGQKKTAKSRA